MLVPIFSLQLNNKIIPRTLAIGKFNGKRSCLVGATSGNKVLIHSPNETTSHSQKLDGTVSFLNINQVVTSLVCGQLDERSRKDLLVVGTSTNVTVYDIEKNVDLFFKEMPDGANAITIGKWGEIPENLAIIGGNCSIHGLNSKGEDVLWTVTGDNVSSVALLDFNSDGYNELVVGSEDFDMRIFREDKLINQIQETETVISLCPLINTRFAYALSNGTVGLYDRSTRNWRIKSRHMAIVLQAFDINGDGIDEIVTGWSSGKVDARNERTGEVLFKDSFQSPIAGVVKGDYRADGENLLICCSNEGEVRGYKFSVQDPNTAAASIYKNCQEAIRDLMQNKQAILLELESIEQTMKTNSEEKQKSKHDLPTNIPANTEICITFTVERNTHNFPAHIAIRMKTSNKTNIRAVSIFAEGLFRGESFVVHPDINNVRDTITIPIIPPRDVTIDVHFQVFIGHNTSTLYHVFESSRPLPTFSMYVIIPNSPEDEPKGYVTFHLNERIQRIVFWLNHHFLFAEEYICRETNLYITFLAVRTDTKLVIKTKKDGELIIRTDDIELAGNIIQSLGKFLNIEDLQTVADFPQQLQTLRQIFAQIEDYKTVRQKISSDMSEHASIIRSFIIRAEDSRLLGDIGMMRQCYMDLINLNRDLINGYLIRCTNHEELTKNLRYLNQMVQKAGNLRIGKYKTSTINQCRTAIKENNFQQLIKSIKNGDF